jgi:hypothetical protein
VGAELALLVDDVGDPDFDGDGAGLLPQPATDNATAVAAATPATVS